ncbi:MAG TPA: hypothetical protein VF495_17130 [Phenylobacterium sp.]
MAGSLVGHALVVAVLVGAQPRTEVRAEAPAIVVSLVTPPPPPEPPPPPPDPEPQKPAPPKPPAPKKAAPPKPQARKMARPAKAPPTVAPILAVAGKVSRGDAEVSDAELAGAATAGSGSGGGGRPCNMAHWLQTELRKDRSVKAALSDSEGKAIRIWNGDWVRHGEQEGQGLAQVHEAIMWHVAFAPEACRAEPVRGLVLLSLTDGPGSTRIVMGSSTWRWSDLLHARRGG